MSATPYTPAFGRQFFTSTDNSSWSLLGHTIDVDGASPERGEIRVTNDQSADNGEEIYPGMKKWGDVSFDLVYDYTKLTTINAMLNVDPSTTQYYFKELWTDTHGVTYPGFLKSAKNSGKTEDGALMLKVTIRVQGKPVAF